MPALKTNNYNHGSDVKLKFFFTINEATPEKYWMLKKFMDLISNDYHVKYYRRIYEENKVVNYLYEGKECLYYLKPNKNNILS